MKSVDDVLRVVLDDVRVREDGYPVSRLALGRLDAVHAEATGQTSNATKHRLERFRQMMRDVVFEDYAEETLASPSLVSNLNIP